ncbi:uncharacterized protein EAF02_001921 [Botrytis sinoallii]|uniref:uncharacterized protein n=1 Tax=Botrytis sinoallii TaxID=1463999 RepID=UPI001902B7EC|nr:uncharacterized protein EAF02_001921 [Botrytis sinoallii]KAF7889506.1 hypothetical protein EAF02_001921 [Botrytis sinoallii]
MPPKKVVKAPAKGKKVSAHLAAAAAAATVVATCEPRNISNRTLQCEAKGIPWFIGTMRENFNQALCRTQKAVESDEKWQAANPAHKKAMVQAARSQKEQQERDLGYDWQVAARNMGFRTKGNNFLWKEGCPIYGTAGASDPTEEEEEEEEELPFSLPDNEPTTKKRRRDDEDDDEDDPNGDYTKRAFKLPPSSPVLCGLRSLDLWCRPAPLCFPWVSLIPSIHLNPFEQSTGMVSQAVVRLCATPWPPGHLFPLLSYFSPLLCLRALHKAAGGRNIWTCLVEYRELQAQIKLFLRSSIIFTRAKTS